MPEPMATPKEQNMLHAKEGLGIITSISDGITPAFYLPENEQVEQESMWHPVKAIKDLIAAIKENTQQTNLVLKQLEMERLFRDIPIGLGLNVSWRADYDHRKYIYAWSNIALTLVYNQTTTKAIAANTWVNISPPRGTEITVQGGNDSFLSVVTFRLCDHIVN